MDSRGQRIPLLERILQQLGPRNWDYNIRVLLGREDTHAEDDSNSSNNNSQDEDEGSLTTEPSPQMLDQKQESELPNNIVSHSCKKENHSPLKHIQSREVGLNTKGQQCEAFSKSDQFCIFSRYLPNSTKQIINNQAKVFCGNYSEDGTVFMSASQDCHIKLYDTTTGTLRQFQDVIAQNVGWSVVDTAYSHDKRHLIYSSWSPNIYLCDIAFGSGRDHIPLNMRPETHSFCAFSITFSQDDSEILTGSNDESLYIYDRNCGKRTLRIHGHTDDVNAVSFCDQSSQLLFSGSDDGLCKVWDRRTLNEQSPEPVGTFAGHAAGIAHIDSKGDGRYLITNCKDQTIKLWDLRAFSNRNSIKAGRKATAANQFWDYRWEAVPRKFRSRVKVKGDPSVKTYRGHVVLKCLIRSHFSPSSTTGQKYIYTGSADGSIIVYDLHTGETVQRLVGHKTIVRDVSWHPYKPLIISSSWDCSVRCWHYSRDRSERERSENEVDEEEPVVQEERRRDTYTLFLNF